MTQRRRFYPTRPAQQLPGSTVELALQLRPLGAPAAAAPPAPPVPPQVGCTGWLCDALQAAEPEGLAFAALPSGAQQISGIEYMGGVLDYRALVASVWEGGTPVALDSYGNPRPWPGPGYRCTQVEIDTWHEYTWPGTAYIAVLTGPAHWVATWDTPFVEDAEYCYPDYHRAQVLGAVLRINTNGTEGSEELTQTLTAQAIDTATGAVILELIFKAHRHAY